jgi:hypothetical protein
MKLIVKYIFLLLIFINHSYAYLGQDAMDDLSSTEGEYSNSYGEYFLYFIIIVFLIYFFLSKKETKRNLTIGIFIYIFPILLALFLKQIFSQNSLLLTIPLLLLYFFKIDAITNYFFKASKEEKEDIEFKHSIKNNPLDPKLCSSCEGMGKKPIKLVTGTSTWYLCSDCNGTGKSAKLKSNKFEIKNINLMVCPICKGSGKTQKELFTGAFGWILCTNCDGKGKHTDRTPDEKK